MSGQAQTERALPKKWPLAVALAVFLVVVAVGATVNAWAGKYYGYEERFLGTSISRFMASEAWTAVVFAITNSVMTVTMCYYLWRLGMRWSMPKIYHLCVMVMAMGLVMLSFFPVGWGDPEGTKSLITLTHEMSSRTMFIMMGLIAAIIALCKRASRVTRTIAFIYVLYALLCMAGFLLEMRWFWLIVFIAETLYVVGFGGVLLSCYEQKTT